MFVVGKKNQPNDYELNQREPLAFSPTTSRGLYFRRNRFWFVHHKPPPIRVAARACRNRRMLQSAK